MKKGMWMRALALLTATAAVMTDSGMVYAAEVIPEQQEVQEEEEELPEEPAEVEVQTAEEEAEKGSESDLEVQEEAEPENTEPETVTEEKTWEPVFTEAADWEERFSFEQPQIGEQPEEDDSEEAGDFYVTYYGDQLEDDLASELYESLTAEEQKELTFENVTTEEVENAAQAAFDAFFMDETEWTAEELKDNCNLQIQSTGTVQEDGETMWNTSVLWTLPEKADPDEKEQEEVTEEAEESENEELSQEEAARLYRKQYIEEEIPCVLMVSVEDEGFIFQNAVCDEEGIWQLEDPMKEEESAEEDEPAEQENEADTQEETQESRPVVVEGLTDEAQETEKPAQTEETEEPEQQAVQPETTEPEGQETVTTESGIAAYSAKQEPALQNVSVTGVKAQTYTGKPLAQKVKVKDTTTGKLLKEGKDYTVSYENNVNAGTASAVIRGVDGSGHTGVLRVDFTIAPQNVAKKVKATVQGKKFLYTGDELKPGVSLVYNRMTLAEGTDYQISYANNIAKGNGQIIVNGQGNYTGMQVVKFKISGPKMKDASVSLSSSSAVYSGASSYPSVTVTYAGKTCVEGTDYIVKYPKTLKAGKNAVSVVGRGNFSGSVKLNYTLDKAAMETSRVSIPYAWQYSKKVNPVPSSVTMNGTALNLKKDYTIKYYSKATGKTLSKIKAEGEYQILMIGKGSYTGTKTLDICVTSDQNILANNYDSGWEPEPEPEPEPEQPADNNNASSGAEDTVIPEDTVYPQNEVPASHDRYWGYNEQYKITSKKGIQGTSNYTEDLGVQHVLLNVDMADLISTTPRDGYVPYTYKGKTYYFGDLIALKDTIYYLHGWGSKEENPYGANHMRNVTLVLLMSWKDELSYLIHPSARKKGAAPYYALNMQDENARDTFEALFRYMGEWLGQYKTRVSNWTLGNEVNSCSDWNYSGGMSLKQCMENYAKAFQLLYKGVKRTATSSRVFISLDHCWTGASKGGHKGKDYLDQFAAYMAQTAPDMEWNVNYHPYSDPLGSTNFWGNTSSTSNSSNTKYISMRNINVLTDYLSQLESRYGKASGSIRVILGEFGYSANAGNASQEEKQAAALGYGYYIAMANSRIDSYIIRAYQDAQEEGKLKLGLRATSDVAKESYQVYKYLDTSQSESYMNKYLGTVGLNSWSAIPGFDASAFDNNDF